MKERAPYVVECPPQMECIPSKPIFFDLALTQLEAALPVEELEKRIQTLNGNNSSGGFVKGLLGQWWSKS